MSKKADNRTGFRRWRDEMPFTQQEAADALQVSLSVVKNWDSGEVRGKPGTPSAPPHAVRVLMRLIHDGTTIEPWET